MFLAYHIGIENARCGLKRVYSRIDTEFGNLAAEYSSRIKMRECRCGSWVGKVIGRHIHGLHRCD